MKLQIVVIVVIVFSCFVYADEYPNPGSRGVDWAEVKQKVETQDWAKDVVVA
ncbi:hypothetical protein K8I31_22545 [bacterium]|nr:hypothetical protein [bacterium]